MATIHSSFMKAFRPWTVRCECWWGSGQRQFSDLVFRSSLEALRQSRHSLNEDELTYIVSMLVANRIAGELSNQIGKGIVEPRKIDYRSCFGYVE